MIWLHLLTWLSITAVFGYGQGLLMPRLRLVPDNTPEAKQHDFALHRLFPLVWLAIGSGWCFVLPWWYVLIVAGLVRVVVFDVALNQAEGTPLFSVGNTADFDRLQQGIARFFGKPVSFLSAGIKIAAAVLLVWFLWASWPYVTGFSSTVF